MQWCTDAVHYSDNEIAWGTEQTSRAVQPPRARPTRDGLRPRSPAHYQPGIRDVRAVSGSSIERLQALRPIAHRVRNNT